MKSARSIHMLPLPDHGWIYPHMAEAWLRESAEAYLSLAAEGFALVNHVGGADTWALFGSDVVAYTAACIEAAFSGRAVRLEREETETIAASELADLLSRYGEWLRHEESGLFAAEPAYSELCEALRELSDCVSPPMLSGTGDGALQAQAGDGDADGEGARE